MYFTVLTIVKFLKKIKHFCEPRHAWVLLIDLVSIFGLISDKNSNSLSLILKKRELSVSRKLPVNTKQPNPKPNPLSVLFRRGLL